MAQNIHELSLAEIKKLHTHRFPMCKKPLLKRAMIANLLADDLVDLSESKQGVRLADVEARRMKASIDAKGWQYKIACDIGHTLRKHCLAHDWSAKQFAELHGLNQQAIQNLARKGGLSRGKQPSLKIMVQVAIVLDYDLNRIKGLL